MQIGEESDRYYFIIQGIVKVLVPNLRHNIDSALLFDHNFELINTRAKIL